MQQDIWTRRGKNGRSEGFTLLEMAIALGVIGFIVAGIWSASTATSESRKINDATSELYTTVQNMNLMFTGQSLSAPYNTDITSKMIAAQVVPTAFVNVVGPSSASINPITHVATAASLGGTFANNPWQNGTTTSYTGFKIWAISAKTYRVSFYNTTYQGCLKLLTAATSCNVGQMGCPTAVHTAQSTVSCAPNQTNCTGSASATGPGWAAMGVAGAESICTSNQTNKSSVDFDYSL